ncbi:MAG: chorismate synthase [Firmicutes bacterium]|nr:chorismate synthase [Bacillota bacterium]
MRMLTAGESHGPRLVVILEGLPAGLELAEGAVDRQLWRRQQGYGRGGRMRIEADRARFISGVRHGRTTGGPVTLEIENRDWERWQPVMEPFAGAGGEAAPQPAVEVLADPRLQQVSRVVSVPRPGHADLAGGLKYGHHDLRDVLERGSARETAARVAAGAVAAQLLRALGIQIRSHVLAIGAVQAPSAPDAAYQDPAHDWWQAAEASPVRCADRAASQAMQQAIDQARAARQTLGGVVEVVACHVPPGLGSYAQWDRRLDGLLAQALMSIPAIKGVEIGMGMAAAALPGGEVHDPILPAEPGEDGFFRRPSNRAGGIEGGVSNGEPIVVRAAMKPLPTLYDPLPSLNVLTGVAQKAAVERSDVCAVPAAAVVAEAMVAWVLAGACREKFGGDAMEDLVRAHAEYIQRLEHFIPARLAGGIVLTGMMGAGKTVVGRTLAAWAGVPFLDTDTWVEQTTGLSVAQVFSQRGEAEFRRLEEAAVQEACQLLRSTPAVVATGGGAVLSERNRRALAGAGWVVWLDAPPSVLVDRILQQEGGLAPGEVRPLLQSVVRAGPGDSQAPHVSRQALTQRLAGILKARRAFYAQAHRVVQTAGKTPEQTACEILSWWRGLPGQPRAKASPEAEE